MKPAEILEFVHYAERLKRELRTQHNEADIGTWNEIEYPRSQYVADGFCGHDEFLRELNGLIKKESREKIFSESGKDIEEILKKADELME